MALTLSCLLWARPGCEEGLADYEDKVLTLVAEHGGAVLSRVRSDGADDHPLEVQLLEFETDAALEGYLADPRRVAMSAERDAAVARTELMRVERIV